MGAWQWYASVNDDIRHHVIERAWHDQKHDSHAFARDVLETERQTDLEPEAGSIYGADPDYPQDLEAFDESGMHQPDGMGIHDYHDMNAGQGAIDAPDLGDIHDQGMELEQ